MKKVAVVLCVIVALLATTFGAMAQSDDAWIPGLASFVLPGLGQLLNDEMDKAILHFGIAVAVDVGAYYLAALLPFTYYTAPIIGLAHLAVGVFSGLDAYNVAKDTGFSIGLIENGIAVSYSF